MTTITFDTLAYVKTLREAGFSESQAEAQVNALANVLRSGTGELATKQDIELIRKDFTIFEERIEGKFKLLQWMITFNLAISVAILWMMMRTMTGH
ncbi:DUF1640 domain-containing protein [Gammaproteobacteria bacterium]